VSDARDIVHPGDSTPSILRVKLELVSIFRFDQLIVARLTFHPGLLHGLITTKLQACADEQTLRAMERVLSARTLIRLSFWFFLIHIMLRLLSEKVLARH